MAGFLRRYAVPSLTLALALGGGVWAFKTARKPAVPVYQTAVVERGRIVGKVTASGTVSALVTVLVGSQVSGRIQDIHVDFNSKVTKGEVLARLDARMFEASVEQARANRSAAEGSLERARVQSAIAVKQRDRLRELAKQKLIAEADLDTAEATAAAAAADVSAATGSLEQTKAALRQAQVNLGYATIVSPVDGIVISRSVDVGQTVAASLAAPTLFTIAEDLTRMQVDTNVAEADVGKLVQDMNVSFVVDAYPQETFRGKVRQVRNAPQTVQNVVTYDAVIDVDNRDAKLKPGMTANVTFVVAERADVVAVPNAALRFKPSPEVLTATGSVDPAASNAAPAAPSGPAGASAAPSGERKMRGDGQGTQGGARDEASEAPKNIKRRTAWVLRDGKLVSTAVVTGLSDGTKSEVVEGSLAAGDTVVIDATLPGSEANRTSGPPVGLGGTPPGGGGMRRGGI